jgi:hypothetical protein
LKGGDVKRAYVLTKTFEEESRQEEKIQIAMNPPHPLSRLPNPYRLLFPQPRISIFGNIIYLPRRFQGIQRSGIGRMPNNPGTPRLANQSHNIAMTPELRASRALVMFLIQHLRNRLQPQLRAVKHPIVLDTALDNQSYKMTGFARHAYSYEKEQYLQENFRFYFLPLKHKGLTRIVNWCVKN